MMPTLRWSPPQCEYVVQARGGRCPRLSGNIRNLRPATPDTGVGNSPRGRDPGRAPSARLARTGHFGARGRVQAERTQRNRMPVLNFVNINAMVGIILVAAAVRLGRAG